MSGEEAGALAPHLGVCVEGCYLGDAIFVDSVEWGVRCGRGGWAMVGKQEVVDGEIVFGADFEVRIVIGAAGEQVEDLDDGAVGAVLNWEYGIVGRCFCLVRGRLERGEDGVEGWQCVEVR